jgi:RHS repeat-associated protein
LGRVTTNVYDALNRQVEVLYADGTKTLTRYDADGRKVAATNQDNIVTWFAYDAAGRLIAVTNALTNVTSYAYDQAGNQTSQIDALGRQTTFSFDGMGRRISRTLPGLQTEWMSYDRAGNQTLYTNFNGVVITNQYDLLNRLVSRISTNGFQIEFAYDAAGNRTNMLDPSGSTAYSYDSRNRLLQKAVSWSGGPSASLNYLYDLNGNVTNIASPGSNSVNLLYSYDSLNRLTTVLQSSNLAAAYGYDAVGNLRAISYGNGVTNLYQYDALNRLTNLVWQSNSTTLASFAYRLGATGVRTNANDNLSTTGPLNVAYTYDKIYRLVTESMTGPWPYGTVSYSYDAVGNRLSRTSTVSGVTNASSAYNTNDWLTGDTYDSNGNTVGDSDQTFAYNAVNQMTNFNNGYVIFQYDGDGNRVVEEVAGSATYFLVDDRNPTGYPQVLEELSQSTSYFPQGVVKVNTFGLAIISEWTFGYPITVRYYGFDGHGNVRFLMDPSGNITDSYTYDAFGIMIASSISTASNDYLYSGERCDPYSGLYYLRARYMSPNIGRFWTMDSEGGNQEDPLSLHKYLFCEDNVVNSCDPSGHSMDWDSYFGYEAEKAIDDEYEATHLGDGAIYGAQQPTGLGSYLKPDIFNTKRKTFLEIKPISESGISKGVSKMILDEAVFGPLTLKFSPEASWQPRSHILQTDEDGPIFVINVGGLVLYKNAKELEWQLISVGSIKIAYDLLPYLYRLSISELAPAVARMTAGLGLSFGTDIGATTGVAVGNGLMGAP